MPALKAHGLFARTLADAWTIYSTSTFVAGAPAISVQHTRPTVRGRSSDASVASPAFIRFDVGVGLTEDPDELVVDPLYVEHNGAVGDLRWRIRWSNNSDLSAPTYDSGTLTFPSPWADRAFAHAFRNPFDDDPAIVASRYVGIDLWDINSIATFVDIGRIYIAKWLQPSLGIERRARVPTPAEVPRRILGAGGESYSVPGKIFQGGPGVAMLFSTKIETQFFEEQIFARRGTNRDLVYIDDPTDSVNLQQQLVYGRVDRISQTVQSAPRRWRKVVGMSEVR